MKVKTLQPAKRLILPVIWVAAFLFVAANLAIGAYYQGKIYPGVTVAGNDLGGQSLAMAESQLTRQVAAYHLVLEVNGTKQSVKPLELGTVYDIELTANQAYQAGRDTWLPLVGLLRAGSEAPTAYAYSVNQTQLSNFATSFVADQKQAPVNATVVVASGVPQVLADKPGIGVNISALESVLGTSIASQTDLVKIAEGPVPAAVVASAAEVAAATAKAMIATPLELDYQGKTYRPTPTQIGSWLSFVPQPDGTLKPELNPDAIKSYLQTIGQDIDIAPVNQQINVVNGVTQGQVGGTAGLAIDATTLAGQIADAVTAQKAATLTIPTMTVAFKTTYNRTISLDNPQYIEVNLTTQHLWAYQDHQVVYDSPVTSGATGAGFGTVTGLFAIYAKQTDRYLDGRPLGYNYNVFVQYWMPFYADFGLHDASWRTTFGGPDYYYDGSHGCVNLPLATAAWLYNWSSVGTPVWVHT